MGPLKKVLKHLDKQDFFPVDPENIREWFLNPQVSEDYVLERH